jgi:hypothetical protein
LPPPAASSSKCLPSSLSRMTSANLQQQQALSCLRNEVNLLL